MKDKNRRFAFRFEYSLVLFVVLFVLSAAFNIWRAKFGYFSRDESLYLAIPYRMLQGDLLLLHEWDSTQMSAALLYPLLKVYLLLFQTTDGIALNFRYIYVFFHSLTALFIFYSLSRKKDAVSCAAALAASILYSLSCYHDIMALSYNSMGIGLLTVFCLILYNNRKPKYVYAFAGAVLAGAVLCCPYLVSVYAVYSIAVFFRRKKKNEAENAFSGFAWLLITASCLIAALLFFLPLLLSGQLHFLPTTLPKIVTDTTHPHRSFVQIVTGYISSFYRYNSNGKIVMAGSVILWIVLLLDKKRMSHRWAYLIIACGLSLLFSYTYLVMYHSCAEHFFSCALIGAVAYALTENRNKRMFATVFIPGIIYSVCLYCASNLEIVAIVSAMTVSMIAAIYFLVEVSREMVCRSGENRRSGVFNTASAVLILASVSIFLFGILEDRMKCVFFDLPPTELCAEFRSGTSGGLKSTPERVEEYDRFYESIRPLREIEDGNVLYLTTESRLYLEDQKKCSSFSMWFWTGDPIQYNKQRLEEYWGLFPEKKPDYIYFDKEQSSDPEFLNAFETEKYKKMYLEEGFVLCLHE